MKDVTQNLQSAWNTSRSKFLQLAPISAFNLWYRDQNTRDRKIIKSISVFVVFCLIIILFVLPFLAQQNVYKTKLDKSLSTYQLLASNAHKFQEQSSISSTSDEPILALVTNQAKRSKINLKRFEPDGNGLRIWLEDAVFDDAARWLEELNQKHGIQIKQINVDRADVSGLVDLRASLYK
jgi:general secretion pathway protein M